MMRALHVVPAIAARYGGPSAAALGMCRALRTVGVGTLIATTDADGRGRLEVPLGRVCQYEDVDVIFFRRRFSEAYKWSGELSGWLESHAGEFDVAHIHAVFSHSSIAAGRACRAAGVPYVVRPLGTLDPWSVNRKRLRKRALLRLGADRLLSGAAAIHYTTIDEERLARSTVSYLPAGAVVPNGIDEAAFLAPAPAGASDPYMLTLGRLDEKKGIDLLIQSVHALAGHAPAAAWRLIIGGDGEPAYVDHLRALAANGPAASRISFAGWIAGDTKLALFRGAGLFVLPSHQENFGISVAEALAASVPVIVTPGVNLAADIEGAAAGWVVERSVSALSAQVARAIAEPAELARRGRNGRALAERFRWSKVAEGLIAMYEQVIVRCAA